MIKRKKIGELLVIEKTYTESSSMNLQNTLVKALILSSSFMMMCYFNKTKNKL